MISIALFAPWIRDYEKPIQKSFSKGVETMWDNVAYLPLVPSKLGLSKYGTQWLKKI